MPRQRSLLCQFACLCALALGLAVVTWSQPRVQVARANGQLADATPWALWTERLSTASGGIFSAQIRWGSASTSSDGWEAVPGGPLVCQRCGQSR